MGLYVDKVEDLFAQNGGIPKELLRDRVLDDIKRTMFIGVPDTDLEVNLEPPDGSDILITKLIDPKKALGYRVFDSNEDYYNNLAMELYVPQEADFGQGAL